MLVFRLIASAIRGFYRAIWESPTLATDEGKPPLQLDTACIEALQEGLKLQEFTCEDLINAYKARIEELNPIVQAISVLNPDATQLARAQDERRKNSEPERLLDGISILLKDVFLTDDLMPSTCGCTGLLHAKPMFEATVVKRLRDAGAIISGKTVPSQWVNYRSPGKAPNGWSAVGGQCKGIYSEDQDPGGSSSGSAVAVALGLATAALGTETSGSIASPARSAGVVAIKPTTGLTSRHGVFCVSKFQDSVGVLARTVRDAAHVLTAIAGCDPLDPLFPGDPRDAEGSSRLEEGFDFREVCRDEALMGMRIAVPRHIIKRDEFTIAQFNEALRVMENLGAVIIEDVEFSEWDLSVLRRPNWRTSFRSDAPKYMEEFLRSYEHNPHNLHTMEDVMRYSIDTAEEQTDQWGMDGWNAAMYVSTRYGMDTEEYKESWEQRLRMSGQIPELLQRYECDIIAVPWWTDTSAPVGGCPQVSVPLPPYPDNTPVQRLIKNLVTIGPNIPTGIMFVASRWQDAKVIAAAHAFEAATNHRKSFRPVVTSSVNLIPVQANL